MMKNDATGKRNLVSAHIDGEYRKYMNWAINRHYQKCGEQLTYRQLLESILDQAIENDAQWQEECQKHKCEIEKCDDNSLLMRIYDNELKARILDLLSKEGKIK